MQNTIDQFVISTLSEIRKKGNIPSQNNNIHSIYVQINKVLSEVLKAPPIKPETALACMDHLVGIGRSTPAFFSLFSKHMMDLYDYAIKKDEFTTNQATVKFLYFFSQTSPESIEQKNRLLEQISKMIGLRQRKTEVARALLQLTNHYGKEKQFNKDPEHNVLKSVGNLLDQMASGKIPQDTKRCCCICASAIQEYAPELYKNSWKKSFSFADKKPSQEIPRFAQLPETPQYFLCSLSSNGRIIKDQWSYE